MSWFNGWLLLLRDGGMSGTMTNAGRVEDGVVTWRFFDEDTPNSGSEYQIIGLQSERGNSN